eukprot:6192821-Pleurochrysis_carterae.AAC.2
MCASIMRSWIVLPTGLVGEANNGSRQRGWGKEVGYIEGRKGGGGDRARGEGEGQRREGEGKGRKERGNERRGSAEGSKGPVDQGVDEQMDGSRGRGREKKCRGIYEGRGGYREQRKTGEVKGSGNGFRPDRAGWREEESEQGLTLQPMEANLGSCIRESEGEVVKRRRELAEHVAERCNGVKQKLQNSEKREARISLAGLHRRLPQSRFQWHVSAPREAEEDVEGRPSERLRLDGEGVEGGEGGFERPAAPCAAA